MSTKDKAVEDSIIQAEEQIESNNADAAKGELENARDVIEDARRDAEKNGDEKMLQRLDTLESRIDELTVMVAKIIPREDEVIDVPATTVPTPPADDTQNIDAPIESPNTHATKKRYFV